MSTGINSEIIDSKVIEKAFDSGQVDDPAVLKAIQNTIAKLDSGELRICTFENKKWQTHQWLKKAILLYFKTSKNSLLEVGGFDPSLQHPFKLLTWVDKVPVKKWTGHEGVRVVPPAVVREGAFVAKGCILMPSYVNIGAYVDSGTMVDTWATVGSCAQVGKNVHLSGGVGLGGVLEPVQANPVIIEDNVFVGSRCIIVEGAHIEHDAVLGAGVTITSSTKILDVSGSTTVEHKGFVPANSVVIPGSIPKKFPSGEFGVNCALIIGKRKESTDKKTSLNQVLREFEISV